MSFAANRYATRLASRAIAPWLLVACALLGGQAGAAEPRSRGEIVVVTVHGTVSSTMAGVTAPLYAGAVLQLPATIRTGRDGAVELRQGATTIAAAADTELEIPQSAAHDGLIERVVQISGNAFYNVAKRERTKLRVETPHLVAVIKGTQFNVAAQADGTTVALFEGRLEVGAPDGSDSIDLRAGEIAIRGRDDISISVLHMAAAAPSEPARTQTAAAAAAAPTAPAPASAATSVASANASASGATPATRNFGTAGSAEAGTTVAPADTVVSSGELRGAAPELDGAAIEMELAMEIDAVAVGRGAERNAAVDVGRGGLAAELDLGAGLHGRSDVAASVDIGRGMDNPASSAALDVGSEAVHPGRDLARDLGAVVEAPSTPSVGASVDLPTQAQGPGRGGPAADIGLDLDHGASAGAGANGRPADSGIHADVDAGQGAPVSVDVGLPNSGGGADPGQEHGRSDTHRGADPLVDVTTDQEASIIDVDLPGAGARQRRPRK